MSTADITTWIILVLVVIGIAENVYAHTKNDIKKYLKEDDGKPLTIKQDASVVLDTVTSFITLTDKVIMDLSTKGLSTKEENLEKILEELSPSLDDDEKKLIKEVNNNKTLIKAMLAFIRSHRTALDIEEKALHLKTE